MNIPTKTLNNDFSLPVFGLGTWKMGGVMEKDNKNDDEADIQAIKNAIDAGITHIDTAELYANGYSEELIKKAIANIDRSKLFIASKVSRVNQEYSQVKISIKGSLKRLGLDYLDLYILHAPSRDFPIEETMKAMDELKAEGLIKNIGVSNFTVKQMERAQKATKNKIVVNQVHYNLIVREVEDRGILDYCQKNDILLMAWRPLQEGELTKSGISILDEMANKYQKTPAQVAINWLISQKNVIAISKMRNPDHLKENIGAVGWEMEKEDIEYLREKFPNQLKVSNTVPLEEWKMKSSDIVHLCHQHFPLKNTSL
jgi:diketogulonate reductase-like aldo/keto reductase